jgi:hypothetical protein
MTDKEIGKIAFNKFGLQECDEDYAYFVLGYKEAIKKQFAITDVVVPKETLPNNCKGCGRTIEEMGKMTSMCGVSACPNY